jgi:HTH-type transcriptional regulator / antitoxin HipB
MAGNIMNFNEEVARAVKFHRTKSGLNQKQLADLAGVGKTAVFDIEKGKETVRLSTLLKVFKALNIKMKLESPLINLMDNKR